jgi:hypothetical protein
MTRTSGRHHHDRRHCPLQDVRHQGKPDDVAAGGGTGGGGEHLRDDPGHRSCGQGATDQHHALRRGEIAEQLRREQPCEHKGVAVVTQPNHHLRSSQQTGAAHGAAHSITPSHRR